MLRLSSNQRIDLLTSQVFQILTHPPHPGHGIEVLGALLVLGATGLLAGDSIALSMFWHQIKGKLGDFWMMMNFGEDGFQ